jgi:simple sugar transport system permease protein
MLLWRGITLMLSGGEQKGLDLLQLPVTNSIVNGVIGDVLPAQFLWFIGFTVFLTLLMHLHRFGNWVFTTGDNREAARAMGISVERIKIACFATVGFAVAFAATMQIFRTATFSARVGDGWELKAIAAAVVGGTALTGGIGSMMGVFWGALVISIIENGLVLMRVQYYWTFTIFGIVIVSTAILSLYIERRRQLMGGETDTGAPPPKQVV